MSNRLGTAFLVADNLEQTYATEIYPYSYGLWTKLQECPSLAYSRKNLPQHLKEYFEDADMNQCFQVSLDYFLDVLMKEPLKQWINGKPTEVYSLCSSTKEEVISMLFGITDTIINGIVIFDYSEIN